MTAATVKQAVSDHGNKLFNGLSGAAIVWLFATFATKTDLQREIDRERQCCKEATAERWRDSMDFFALKGQTHSAIHVGTNGFAISAAADNLNP